MLRSKQTESYLDDLDDEYDPPSNQNNSGGLKGAIGKLKRKNQGGLKPSIKKGTTFNNLSH